MKHFNQLTPAEAERLALLLEELGEAQQVIGKILRHGYASTHPADPSGPTNRTLLEAELGDVQAAVALLRNAGDVSSSRILEAMEDKLGRIGKWLHHAAVFPSERARDPMSDLARNTLDRAEAAEAEAETLRMQLAACSVAALGNTREAVAQRIARDHPYWSAAYGDVCRAVDAEIEAREGAK